MPGPTIKVTGKETPDQKAARLAIQRADVSAAVNMASKIQITRDQAKAAADSRKAATSAQTVKDRLLREIAAVDKRNRERTLRTTIREEKKNIADEEREREKAIKKAAREEKAALDAAERDRERQIRKNAQKERSAYTSALSAKNKLFKEIPILESRQRAKAGPRIYNTSFDQHLKTAGVGSYAVGSRIYNTSFDQHLKTAGVGSYAAAAAAGAAGGGMPKWLKVVLEAAGAIIEAPMLPGQLMAGANAFAHPYTDFASSTYSLARRMGVGGAGLTGSLGGQSWMARLQMTPETMLHSLDQYGITPGSRSDAVRGLGETFGQYRLSRGFSGMADGTVEAIARQGVGMGAAANTAAGAGNYLGQFESTLTKAQVGGMDRSKVLNSISDTLDKMAASGAIGVNAKSVLDTFERYLASGTAGGRTGASAAAAIAGEQARMRDTLGNPATAFATLTGLKQNYGGLQTEADIVRALGAGNAADIKAQSPAVWAKYVKLITEDAKFGNLAGASQSFFELAEGKTGVLQNIVSPVSRGESRGQTEAQFYRYQAANSGISKRDLIVGDVGAAQGPMSTAAIGSNGLYARAGADVQTLMKYGLSRERAEGIVGNVQVESGGNPFSSNALGGGHRGLISWSAPRQKDFAAFVGRSMGSYGPGEEAQAVEDQYRFLAYEISQGKERSRMSDFNKSGLTASQYSTAFYHDTERAGPFDRTAQKRATMAEVAHQASPGTLANPDVLAGSGAASLQEFTNKVIGARIEFEHLVPAVVSATQALWRFGTFSPGAAGTTQRLDPGLGLGNSTPFLN